MPMFRGITTKCRQCNKDQVADYYLEGRQGDWWFCSKVCLLDFLNQCRDGVVVCKPTRWIPNEEEEERMRQ